MELSITLVSSYETQHLFVQLFIHMIEKKGVKDVLKICFVLLQILLAIAGSASLIAKSIFYVKLSSFTTISVSATLLMFLCPLLALWCGLYGYTCLSSRKKIHIFFYVISLTALMNFQVILAMKSGRFVENSRGWLHTQWHGLSDRQKNVVQEKMQCCGFETATDEPGSKCKSEISCSEQISPILILLRNRLQKLLLGLFFVETLCLCLISFLKFGK